MKTNRTPKRNDYVRAIGGHFKGKRGWISRVDLGNTVACVVWRDHWEHGIWTPIEDLKITYRRKQGDS